MTGKIIPFGYAAKGAHACFKTLMLDEEVQYPWVIADIRYHPYASRFHAAFSLRALSTIYTGRYQYIPGLGNVHYRPEDRAKGIQLAHAEEGIATLAAMFRTTPHIILLCACSQYATCHRKLVVELLQQAMPEVEVLL